MKLVVDLHTHTMASGHAYSTLMENAKYASSVGIEVLGTTEHGPLMHSAPHIWHFHNYKVLPRELFGVTMLYGCEADIINEYGEIDIPKQTQKALDIMIVSMHDLCYRSMGIELNTEAFLKAMDNPYVDILGHIGNPQFPINEEEVVKKAKEKDIIIEINNSSLGKSRPGSRPICKRIAELCKKYGNKVILNTDSHFCMSIGSFPYSIEIVEEVGLTEEQIMNTSKDKIIRYLKNKGKLQDINLD
ncbi:phosphatase [Clostridium sp. DL1XJH146]